MASVVEQVCNAQGCDFVLLLGDNHYDIGVEDVNDNLWQSQFEIPYANINLPFYPSLGNHDGGSEFLGGTGVNVSQGDNQVDYTAFSTKWTMPGRWYGHTHGDVDFIALDTSSAFFDGLNIPFVTDDFGSLVDAQETWVDDYINNSLSSWKIAYGHHPYLSNGPHGNAGNYEGFDWIPYANGENIKDFMDNHVCGKVDLYLCGHDHSRQWLTGTCAGTALMVSGAGAKTTDFEGTNGTVWQEDQNPGFVWIEINGAVATVEWWDLNGQLNYTDLLPKPLP